VHRLHGFCPDQADLLEITSAALAQFKFWESLYEVAKFCHCPKYLKFIAYDNPYYQR
jgi:hypothetical protein